MGAIALSLLNLKKMGYTLEEAMALPKREPRVAQGESLRKIARDLTDAAPGQLCSRGDRGGRINH